MENIISIENRFGQEIANLWEANKHLEIADRNFIVPRELKKHSILFIGINPSYPEKNIKKAEQNDRFYELYNPLEMHPYFNKFIEIHNYCGCDWAHWDLLYLRETNQHKIIDLCRDTEFAEFVKQQLSISHNVISEIEPKIIVVCNAKARDFFMETFDLVLDDEIGTFRIKDNSNLNNVPVFFSGMLTGQRALDLGSFQRLQWHIKKVLQKC